MSWKNTLVNLDEGLWNILHVRKYLNGKFGEGKWEKHTPNRKSIARYTWVGDIIVKIQPPTIKAGIIRIIKDGEETKHEVWNLKDIKEIV
jgi:hypothetical protein